MEGMSTVPFPQGWDQGHCSSHSPEFFDFFDVEIAYFGAIVIAKFNLSGIIKCFKTHCA